MSELSNVIVPPDLPMIGTITGSHGSGKTTLASSFPNPIFIQVEKSGLTSIPIDQRPSAMEPIDGDSKKLFRQLGELADEQHPYKTVVIDTVSALEDVFLMDIMNLSTNKKVKSINNACGGYGAGARAIAQEHFRVMKAAEYLCEFRGMHVLFLAHTDTKTIDPPDTDSYTQFSLQMNKYSVAVYAKYSHIVAQCKYKSYVVPSKKDGKAGKAKATGDRIVSCLGEASSVNKNRYRITEDIPFIIGENPFGFLPIFNQPNSGIF